MTIKPFSGEGPGAQTKDGCSVELYRRSRYAGEIEHLVEYLGPGVSVLELGCGAGRITRRLLSLGCAVTAVDNSAEMLAYAPSEACLVRADIEELNLGKTFDVVMLPSGLINHPVDAVRGAFLAAAAMHLSQTGLFLLQRQDPTWLASAVVGPASESDGLTTWIESVSRADGIVVMTLRYTDGTEEWRHSFSLSEVDDASLQSQLAGAGFDLIEWLDDRRRWAKVSLNGHLAVRQCN